MANTIPGNNFKTHTLPADRKFLNRAECLKEAKIILEDELIEGMTQIQIAREIYFHANAYFISRNSRLLRRVREHADPIDLCSGGDTRLRRMFFSICWILPINRRYRRSKQNED